MGIVLGVIYVVLGVPLYLRRVPGNPFLGFRFGRFADEALWDEVNHRGGFDLIVCGIGLMILSVVVLGSAEPYAERSRGFLWMCVMVATFAVFARSVDTFFRQLNDE